MIVQFAPGKYRSSRPEDLAKVRKDFPYIRRIISLQSGFYEFVTETLRERQFPHEFGFEYFDIVTGDFLPPNEYCVQQCLRILREQPEVLVHCFSGVDRTGFIVAAYRMQVEGWTFERAHNEWVRAGRHWWYFWWKYELKKYERKK